ncbi:hypothetical protein NE237_000777 [Protea cynaroides]|uniref:Retrotransposon Copia-like N-terminal domain-containing protein n=1 Tax=Protea cynaroides TaxID=273540 RepID=A0A9Q0KS35_9MAGN|nr:hypothetical protein NE237_000777 [Protea cynaroides]
MASLNTQSEKTSTDGTTTAPIAIDGTNSTLFSPPLVISNRASLIPIKLSSSNYLLWQSLFEPILHGPKLLGLIDGTVPSPISPTSPWYERDQMLLSWINATLNKAALPYIVVRSSNLSFEELHTLLICEEIEVAKESLTETSSALIATHSPHYNYIHGSTTRGLLPQPHSSSSAVNFEKFGSLPQCQICNKDKTKGNLLFQGPVENGLHHSSILVSVIYPIPFKRLSAISSLAQINEMFAFAPHFSLLRVIGLCFLSLHLYLIVLWS